MCKDSVILSSDSRTIDPKTGRIIADNTEKIFTIDFAGGGCGIIAQAGAADLGNRAIEIIRNLAKGETPYKPRFLANLAERAMAELKSIARSQIGESSERLQQHFLDYDFSLIGAHWTGTAAYLFAGNFYSGYAAPIFGSYKAVGSGAPLADFILKSLRFPEIDFHGALMAAIYAIEEIKKHEAYIGGPPQAGALHLWGTQVGDVLRIPIDKIYLDSVEECKGEIEAAWSEKMNGIFARIQGKL
jgi:20S proteasome alpha/beta subunit